MIYINHLSEDQVVRTIPNLVEPFIVRLLQKKFHTFFVYRCSDYVSFDHLVSSQKFDISYIIDLVPLIDTYWSAIDIIYFSIPETKVYTGKREYFDILRKKSVEMKFVLDVEFFEVKLTTSDILPNLSVRTAKFCEELEQLGRFLHFAKLVLKGDFRLDFDLSKLRLRDFAIRTHYGRKRCCIKKSL
ncbi:hypothetical protein K9M74_03985 [Candidatus Woesearchaeota archaeon]|nr:hypothetical protein [Candidatus Woesearchaeota archaeon]